MYDDVYVEPELLDTVEKIAAHEQEPADDPEALRHEYALKLIDKADKQGIKFCNALHKGYYGDILSAMKSCDCYHRSMAYLLALDSVLSRQPDSVFDFQEDMIKRDGLHKGFQTGTSMKTTRLAFNLWNGCCDDGEMYTDKDGYETDLPSHNYAPDEIFSSIYAPYYWQAIRLRFEI